MADVYKLAAQLKLRFPSKRGDLLAEQLFDLPLKSATGFDLDTVAKGLSAQLKGASEESFVEDTTADPRKTALTVALQIVKDVIKTKQEENRAAADRRDRAEKRKKLLDALAAKEEQQLSAASIEDLKKQLADLG